MHVPCSLRGNTLLCGHAAAMLTLRQIAVVDVILPTSGGRLVNTLTERKHLMNVLDVVIKIKSILHDRFDIDTSAMNNSTKLSDLGIDSLHLADMMLDLETELDITIEDLPLLPETTLGDLAAIVSNRTTKIV